MATTAIHVRPQPNSTWPGGEPQSVRDAADQAAQQTSTGKGAAS